MGDLLDDSCNHIDRLVKQKDIRPRFDIFISGDNLNVLTTKKLETLFGERVARAQELKTILMHRKKLEAIKKIK